MTDKTTRDTLRNANFQDTYIHTVDQPWIPFSEGIDIKVLRTSAETGTWSVLFKCAKGSAFARHEHLGSGEYLMLTRWKCAVVSRRVASRRIPATMAMSPTA